MIDVLLVKPHSQHSVLPPLGLGYLSSALKKEGMNTRIVHGNKDNLDVAGIAETVKEQNIDIIGASCCSNDHPWLLELAKKLDSESNVHLIVGGAHATGLGKRLMELIPRIDFIMRSEGELAFPKLIRSLKNNNIQDRALSSIPNLVWKDATGQIHENAVELPTNLDALEFPDWDQMRPDEYAKFAPHGGSAKAYPVGQLMTTRGCPYACNYCAGSLIHGRKIRRRSPESIIEEIQYLMKSYDVKEIHIEDDNFTFHKDHVIDLCTGIRKKNIKAFFTLPNGIRLDKIDDEILNELQATGFYSFSVGIESGSQATLKRMSKALDLSKVRESIALIRRYNFHLNGYFMLGYPGETSKEINETIEFAKSLDLDRAYFTMYIPLPGTKDFYTLEEQGKIDIHTLEWENFFTKGETKPPFVPNGMTVEELQEFAHVAYREFYLRPKIIFKLLKDLKIESFQQFTEVVYNLASRNLSYFI